MPLPVSCTELTDLRRSRRRIAAVRIEGIGSSTVTVFVIEVHAPPLQTFSSVTWRSPGVEKTMTGFCLVPHRLRLRQHGRREEQSAAEGGPGSGHRCVPP